nr:PREDICTED: uncharacterized protein LOC106497191 [Apteryx mantelli mantelli]
MPVAALRCGTALSTFCEYPAEEPDALASPRPLRKHPSLLGTNPEAATEMPVTAHNQSRSRYGRSRISPKKSTDPIGNRCRRPSSAIGEPIGRSPLFRPLPGPPEDSRRGRANGGTRSLTQFWDGFKPQLEAENGSELRLASPVETSDWLAGMRRSEDAIQLPARDQSAARGCWERPLPLGLGSAERRRQAMQRRAPPRSPL